MQQQQQQSRSRAEDVQQPASTALREVDVWEVIEKSQQLQGSYCTTADDRAHVDHDEVMLSGCGADDDDLRRAGRADGSSDAISWLNIAQIIWSSLHASFQHIDTLGLDTVAFGCMALANKHDSEEYTLRGRVVDEVSERLTWLQQVQWCMSIYEVPRSLELLAEDLGLQPSHILSYEPHSLPLCPAYFLAVDHPGRTIVLVIRGTSQLHDLVADVCGHCVPFLHGFAHCGMLTACDRILSLEMGRIEAACREFPGYRLNIIGHSLGGGIAALMAVRLFNSGALQEPLGWGWGHGAGPRITATCFGAPPVMTLELAQACASYVSSVVLENDVIARLSVESLRVLSQEMDVCKDEVINASGMLSWARDWGAVAVSRALVSQLCRMYATRGFSSLASAVTQSPTVSSVVAAGLTWVGTWGLSSRSPAVPPSAAADSNQPLDLASAAASAAASTAASALRAWSARVRDRQANQGPVPESSFTSLSDAEPAPRPAAARQLTSAPASTSAALGTLLGSALSAWQSSAAASAAARPPAATAASTSTSAAQGRPAAPFSSSLAASMAATAVTVAAAAAATALSARAPAPAPAPKYSLPSPPDSSPSTFTDNPLSAHPPPSSAPAPSTAASSTRTSSAAGGRDGRGVKGGPGSACGSGSGAQAAPESQRQHPLNNAGQLYLIKRPAVADPAVAASAQRGYVMKGHPGQQFQRVLIKKSMLQDHFLKQYQHAISNTL